MPQGAEVQFGARDLYNKIMANEVIFQKAFVPLSLLAKEFEIYPYEGQYVMV